MLSSTFMRRSALAACAGITGLLIAGCSGKTGENTPGLLMSNDFESLQGWLGQAPQPSLTTEQAHSGKYSLKIDPSIEYGLPYVNTLGRMNDSRFTKIKLDAWVFVPKTDAGVSLVTQINAVPAADKPLLWDGFDIAKAAGKANEWVHVNKVITIPAGANASSSLSIYLWRTAPTTPACYIDDLTVSKED